MNALSEALAHHRASGRPLLDLSVSNPTQVGLNDFTSGVGASWLADLGATASVFPYRPEPLGEYPARAAVAEYLRSQGQIAHAESIGLASGTSEAYAFLFKMVGRPGDEILTFTPGYPLCDALIEWAGLKQIPFAARPQFCDGRLTWSIDWTKVEHCLTNRTRALVLIHPNNPTGHYFTSDDWQAAYRLAQDHDLALIVDTVFFDYAHVSEIGVQPAPVPHSTGPLVITLGGLSKTCGLPQLKLAWAAFDGADAKVREALERWEWMADLFLSVATPVQRLAPRLLAERMRFQAPLRERLAANLGQAKTLLQGTRIRPHWPGGGWSLPLVVTECGDDEAFCLDLLRQHHTLVQPGYFFDYAEDGLLVVSLITPTETFRRGLAALGQLAATL